MKYLAVLVLLLTIPTTFAATFPKPVGYVNDFAGILPNSAALEQEVRAYERNTTIEIAIVTIDALPQDQTAATYANELFREWSIGKKGEDNGILVLIIKNGTVGNRLRIELGYSIQGYITGAEAGRILDVALPYYSAGDYQQTARTILDGLYKQLEKYVPGQPPQKDALDNIGNYMPVIFFLFWIGLIAGIPLLGYYFRKCPQCGGRKFECHENYCVCKKCGKKIKRGHTSGFWIFAGGAGGGFGGGGGGGGFGGGGSGGGGAGR